MPAGPSGVPFLFVVSLLPFEVAACSGPVDGRNVKDRTQTCLPQGIFPMTEKMKIGTHGIRDARKPPKRYHIDYRKVSKRKVDASLDKFFGTGLDKRKKGI